ncbi:DUF475 domain-containing protein [Mycobacterium sp.]|uniref:DUF475 domain-containing protein n=1 Tax=Mycobacterium sp. TaxID=1785 RepID=UPI0025E6991D|nr:DUF475 domain-containing protein [Mycobacterium sp.]
MAAFRIFGISLLVTAAALAVGYAHGGAKDLFLLLVLAVLEVSLSFDNAIINAAVLQRMSRFWRQMFLTIGILIAVFGMRLVFPLVIVWATALGGRVFHRGGVRLERVAQPASSALVRASRSLSGHSDVARLSRHLRARPRSGRRRAVRCLPASGPAAR